MVDSTINKGGAPKGNQNAVKGFRATHALEMLVKWFDENGFDPIDWDKMEKIESSKTLMKMWEPQVRNAMENGNLPALQAIVDRLDGRPRQALDIGGQDDNPLKVTKVELVPLSDDSASTDTE